ncbi:hypothetical protein L9F63_001581, partial [Diploptera punctata]
ISKLTLKDILTCIKSEICNLENIEESDWLFHLSSSSNWRGQVAHCCHVSNFPEANKQSLFFELFNLTSFKVGLSEKNVDEESKKTQYEKLTAKSAVMCKSLER